MQQMKQFLECLPVVVGAGVVVGSGVVVVVVGGGAVLLTGDLTHIHKQLNM